MSPECWRAVFLIATIAGSLVTIYGLIAAYLAAKSESDDAAERVRKMKQLRGLEDRLRVEAEVNGTIGDRHEALIRQSKERYEAAGLIRPDYDNTVYLAAYESERLLGRVLTETKRDFIIAGVGLVISTFASAGSLFLASP